MNRHNFVCFSCKTAYRRRSCENVLCSVCGKECKDIGYKVRLPKKGNDRDWLYLKIKFS